MQAQRPSGTFSLGACGGATAYGDELDSCADYLDPDVEENEACELGRGSGGLDFGVGAELGYPFTRGIGFSLCALYGQYKDLDRPDAFNPDLGTFGRLNEGEGASQLQGLFRLNTAGRVAPQVKLGGAVIFGQGHTVNGARILGYGLRCFFRPPYTEVDAMIDGATELTVARRGCSASSKRPPPAGGAPALRPAGRLAPPPRLSLPAPRGARAAGLRAGRPLCWSPALGRPAGEAPGASSDGENTGE